MPFAGRGASGSDTQPGRHVHLCASGVCYPVACRSTQLGLDPAVLLRVGRSFFKADLPSPSDLCWFFFSRSAGEIILGDHAVPIGQGAPGTAASCLTARPL